MISFPAGQKEQPSKPDYYSGSDYSAADYYWLQKPNLLPYLASLILRNDNASESKNQLVCFYRAQLIIAISIAKLNTSVLSTKGKTKKISLYRQKFLLVDKMLALYINMYQIDICKRSSKSPGK
ncbi:MAG: hypothetical protein J6T97_07365 [Bacteroidaceae bacterium]|nr:hypothetical protein [Bacteroidaceae bacterium]